MKKFLNGLSELNEKAILETGGGPNITEFGIVASIFHGRQ